MSGDTAIRTMKEGGCVSARRGVPEEEVVLEGAEQRSARADEHGNAL